MSDGKAVDVEMEREADVEIAPATEGDMDLMCAVYSLGYMFTVTSSRKEKGEMLRNAVASVLGVRSFEVTLRLARKDNQWLRVDGNTEALLREPIDPSYKKMLVPFKLSRYFGPAVDLEEGVIHLLVELPEDFSPTRHNPSIVEGPQRESNEASVSAEVQLEKLMNALEWREPKRLCTSAGHDWSYQGASELGAVLIDPLVQHYNA